MYMCRFIYCFAHKTKWLFACFSDHCSQYFRVDPATKSDIFTMGQIRHLSTEGLMLLWLENITISCGMFEMAWIWHCSYCCNCHVSFDFKLADVHVFMNHITGSPAEQHDGPWDSRLWAHRAESPWGGGWTWKNWGSEGCWDPKAGGEGGLSQQTARWSLRQLAKSVSKCVNFGLLIKMRMYLKGLSRCGLLYIIVCSWRMKQEVPIVPCQVSLQLHLVLPPLCHVCIIMWCDIMTESSESQYLQAEDRGNKLKQLLVKAKKDLAEAKKTVSHSHCSQQVSQLPSVTS